MPFTLPENERNLTADGLFNLAVSNAVGNPNAWKWDGREWKEYVEANTYSIPKGNRVKAFSNMSYMNIGFWNLLYDQVSQEGYRYLTEAGGYDSNTINWNSAVAMPYVASGDYGSGATYLRLVGGYSTLPVALAQLISEQIPISFNTRLKGFTRRGGVIDVTTVSGGGAENTFQTKYLLLCMPTRSIELLDPDTEFGTYMRGAHLFKSVIRQPSFKLLLLFDTEWWKR